MGGQPVVGGMRYLAGGERSMWRRKGVACNEEPCRRGVW